MMTSCGTNSSRSAARSCALKGGGGNGTRTGAPNKPKGRQFPLKRARREPQRVPGRVPGLSAPMLKELLRGKPRPRGGEARGGFPVPAAAFVDGDTRREFLPGQRGEGEGGGGGGERYSKGAGGVVLNGEDAVSDASASKISDWRSVDGSGSGMRDPDAAAWLKGSSLVGLPGGRGVAGESSVVAAELRRIFSDTVRKLD